MRASASPNAAWRALAAVIGPVGLADTYSTLTLSGVSGVSRPQSSPASITPRVAFTYQASARKRLRKPGPATSTRSTLSPRRSETFAPSRSAISRGGAPSAGASSIAALVE